MVMKCLVASKADSIVIDDAGYLITNHFMRGHASAGKGNAVFSLYNDIGDYFWQLIQFIVTKVPQDKIVYMMMQSRRLSESCLMKKFAWKVFLQSFSVASKRAASIYLSPSPAREQ